MDVDCTLDFG